MSDMWVDELQKRTERNREVITQYQNKISRVWDVINQLESEDDYVSIGSIALVLRKALQDD